MPKRDRDATRSGVPEATRASASRFAAYICKWRDDAAAQATPRATPPCTFDPVVPLLHTMSNACVGDKVRAARMAAGHSLAQNSVCKDEASDMAGLAATAVVYDAVMCKHASRNDDDVERPLRLLRAVEHLRTTGLLACCTQLRARPARTRELCRVHTRAHVDAVDQLDFALSCRPRAKNAAVALGDDLYVCRHTARAARVAAGCAVVAASAIMSGKAHNALALVRPPGHHAYASSAGGFCFYNNVAVAARAVQATMHVAATRDESATALATAVAGSDDVADGDAAHQHSAPSRCHRDAPHGDRLPTIDATMPLSLSPSSSSDTLARPRARVLIVDWDVHHGDGTEAIFYDDPSVLVVSLHQYKNKASKATPHTSRPPPDNAAHSRNDTASEPRAVRHAADTAERSANSAAPPPHMPASTTATTAALSVEALADLLHDDTETQQQSASADATALVSANHDSARTAVKVRGEDGDANACTATMDAYDGSNRCHCAADGAHGDSAHGGGHVVPDTQTTSDKGVTGSRRTRQPVDYQRLACELGIDMSDDVDDGTAAAAAYFGVRAAGERSTSRSTSTTTVASTTPATSHTSSCATHDAMHTGDAVHGRAAAHFPGDADGDVLSDVEDSERDMECDVRSVESPTRALFYPGTGHALRVGGDACARARGRNINIPWPVTGMGDLEYLLVLQHFVVPVAREFAPDVVFISCGFDSARGDLLGSMNVTPSGYYAMTALLLQHFDRMVVVLEGGYNAANVAVCCEAVLRALLECNARCAHTPHTTLPQSRLPIHQAQRQLEHTRRIHADYWSWLRACAGRDNGAASATTALHEHDTGSDTAMSHAHDGGVP